MISRRRWIQLARLVAPGPGSPASRPPGGGARPRRWPARDGRCRRPAAPGRWPPGRTCASRPGPAAPRWSAAPRGPGGPGWWRRCGSPSRRCTRATRGAVGPRPAGGARRWPPDRRPSAPWAATCPAGRAPGCGWRGRARPGRVAAGRAARRVRRRSAPGRARRSPHSTRAAHTVDGPGEVRSCTCHQAPVRGDGHHPAAHSRAGALVGQGPVVGVGGHGIEHGAPPPAGSPAGLPPAPSPPGPAPSRRARRPPGSARRPGRELGAGPDQGGHGHHGHGRHGASGQDQVHPRGGALLSVPWDSCGGRRPRGPSLGRSRSTGTNDGRSPPGAPPAR